MARDVSWLSASLHSREREFEFRRVAISVNAAGEVCKRVRDLVAPMLQQDNLGSALANSQLPCLEVYATNVAVGVGGKLQQSISEGSCNAGVSLV